MRQFAFGTVTGLLILVGVSSAWGQPVVTTRPVAAEYGSVGPGVPAFAVRPGYRVTLAATGLKESRALEFDDHGTLYVSQPKTGAIVALRDPDANGLYKTSTPFITGKKTVHGMYFIDGWLWFTQSGAIYKVKVPPNGAAPAASDIVTIIPEGSLPSGGGHWWRPILVNDQYLFTGIGDDQNDSDHSGDDREKIWRYNLDGTGKTLFVSGIRNTEKLRFRPDTTEIYGMDHGSDNYGGRLGETQKTNQPVTDMVPPEEFNHYIAGGFYGHPFIIGNRMPRLEAIDRPEILELANKTTVPEWCFGSHWASCGFTFLTKEGAFGHRGDVVVCFHGSWNSTKKVGYQVDELNFDPWTGKPYGARMLVSTLSVDGENSLARPVDAMEAPDGSILFSCDVTRKVYRITKESK